MSGWGWSWESEPDGSLTSSHNAFPDISSHSVWFGHSFSYSCSTLPWRFRFYWCCGDSPSKVTSIFHVTYLCCVESLSIHNLLSEESAPPCSSTMTVAMCLALIINPLIINQHSLLTSVTPAVCRNGYLSHSVIMWLQKQQAISMPLSLKHFVLLATDYL